MSPRSMWLRRAGLAAAGALVTTSPVLLAERATDGAGGSMKRERSAAAAWTDVIPGVSGPQLPAPGDSESAIVVLTQPALAQGGRAELIALEQQRLEAAVGALGGTINFRYRALVNGLGVRVPTGRLAQVADMPGVSGVYPVAYLLPAQVGQGTPQPLPASATTPTQPAPAAPGSSPRTIALIDAGIHPQHPSLGGGMGPDRLILGGADFVTGQSGPEAPAQNRLVEAHGTQMAALVTTAPELRGLAPDHMPRLRAYRVMAQEVVNGREQLLARTDRVLAAMDRAADPDQNGDVSDHASVILLGMARAGGAGDDPLAQAAAAADALGSLVVAPAGNAGPGPLPQPGTVGSPGSSPHVLTVGGLAGPGPRTATLALRAGADDSTIRGVALLGPTPPAGALRTVVLAGADGLVAGTDVREYTDARGQSRVQGALVVVGRGGGSLAQKARAAQQAGAAALAVWDHAGSGHFPGISAEGDIVLPVVGLGAAQGTRFMDRPDLRVRIVSGPVTAADAAVASFSGRGPTPDGGAEPDLVAPAVDVLTAAPGTGAEPLAVRMSGTSAAAARVAAIALRMMVDDPRLSPADVRSALAQSAEPIAGASITAQGAGSARLPSTRPSLAIEPAVVGMRRRVLGPTTVTVTLHDLEGTARQVRLAVVDAFGVPLAPPGEPVTLAADGRVQAQVVVPAGDGDVAGRLMVIAPDARVLAQAPLVLTRRTRSGVTIAPPQVVAGPSGTDVRVVVSAPAGAAGGLHAVWLRLVPVGTGRAVALTNPKVVTDWSAGSYRLRLTRRDVHGRAIAPGRYRLRVEGLDPAGGHLRATSAAFWIK